MFGAVAPIIVLYFMMRQPNKVTQKEMKRLTKWNSKRLSAITPSGDHFELPVEGKVNKATSAGLWTEIKNEPLIWRKMLGTGGSWLFFDWSFYGNHLLQGKILAQIIPGDTATDAWENISLDLVGVGVVILSILLLPWAGVRWLQFWGFFAGGVCCLLIGLLWDPMIDNTNGVLLALYYLQYGSYWIPNTTTYTMSALVYKPSIRSTMNGISAAAGKVGAIIGVTLFTLLFDECDGKDKAEPADGSRSEYNDCVADTVQVVMFTSMAAAIAGMFCTMYGVGLEPTGMKKGSAHAPVFTGKFTKSGRPEVAEA